MVPWIQPGESFPDPARALSEPNGLLCVGGDLSAASIIKAYRRGIYPWFNDDQPILWWSPNPRLVLFPDELRVSASLAKTIRRNKFTVTFDSAFAEVIAGCAAPRTRDGGTWIVPAMIEAYRGLHALGVAHSAESWRDGVLVGGLYGIALGSVFFGESMFTRETDASKVAFVALLQKLIADGFQLIDCQQETRHLTSFGARPIPRTQWLQRLQELINSAESDSDWR